MMRSVASIDGALQSARRYSGLLLAGVLLLAYLLNVVVYSSANLSALNGDLENPEKLLPAVAARPLGFILIGLMSAALGAAIVLLVRTLAERLSPAVGNLTRFAMPVAWLACVLFVLYGLYSAIRLPWLASDFMRDPNVAPAFKTYLDVSEAFLNAAYIALGGALLFICWAMMREKLVSRYLTLLGLAWGLAALLFPFAAAGVVALGEFCGLLWTLFLGFALLGMLDPKKQGGPTDSADERSAPATQES